MAGTGLFIGIFGLVFYLFILLLPIALLVALQVWMCKKGKWLGLVLPGISLVLSLILVSSIAAFTTVGGGSMRVADENGQVVQIEPEVIGEPQPVPGAMRNAVLVFLVTNIPTVVFGGIWLHYKGRRDTYEDLKRMRIEDLE